MGTFDPEKDDVFVFINRLQEVAILRGPQLVQLNVSLQLRNGAQNWYNYELTEDERLHMRLATGIQAWTYALENRFRPSPTRIMEELDHTKYTRADASARYDPVEFLHKILRLTRGRSYSVLQRLTIAFTHFEAPLRVNLSEPSAGTSIQVFIEQLDAKKYAWFENYASFRKKDIVLGNDRHEISANQNAQPNRQFSHAKSGYTRGGYHSQNAAPRDYGQDPRPTIYKYSAVEQKGRPQASAYQVAEGKSYPSGHTPREFGNTHDDDPYDAYHADADSAHHCSHPKCPHWHSEV